LKGRTKIKSDDLLQELEFKTSKSGGPGGQHANKVNTKVTLRFDVANSTLLSSQEKKTIKRKLASRISKEGVLILTASDKRSQLENKKTVLKKLESLLAKAFRRKRIRKPTKPTKASKKKRLEKKKHRGEKKKWRKKII